ncbi:MAG: hypothetical protein GX425_07405 [Peptococcaceae bacterium]|nr:hypothetical protein [Peptococcaceae bacterium]
MQSLCIFKCIPNNKGAVWKERDRRGAAARSAAAALHARGAGGLATAPVGVWRAAGAVASDHQGSEREAAQGEA